MDGVCQGAESTMRAHLAELDGCWLHIRCGGCPSSAAYPFRLLIGKYGPDHEVGAIVARLACKRCRRPPADVTLADAPNAVRFKGASPSWSRQLIDRPPFSAVDRARAEARSLA